jgi:L-fuculose-phosphate aldolase
MSATHADATDREAELRFTLSAARRIISREHGDDGVLGVLCARPPGAAHVLATPVGFGELAVPDRIERVPLAASAGDLPPTVSRSLAVALAIHRRRPDAGAVVHTHAHHASVVSATRRPIGVFNEMSTMYFEQQVIADDDGDRSPEACERLAAALGDRRVLLLVGHGIIAVAPTVQEAAIDALAVERAARWDNEARPYGGQEITLAHIRQTKPLYDRYFRGNMWEANLRRLRRSDPDLFEHRPGQGR